MVTHNIYAQIYNETVENVMVCDNYEMANWITRMSYGDEAFAVECMQFPCTIGDKYYDGKFYRVSEDGKETPIEYVPTQEEQVIMLESENSELKKQITDTQLALCEIYEHME